jgi:hypothetical protein
MLRNSKSGLYQPIRHGQRVIEYRVIGEISHGEIVNPFQRTEMPYSLLVNPDNRQLSREHASSLKRIPSRLRHKSNLNPAACSPFRLRQTLPRADDDSRILNS